MLILLLETDPKSQIPELRYWGYDPGDIPLRTIARSQHSDWIALRGHRWGLDTRKPFSQVISSSTLWSTLSAVIEASSRINASQQ